MKRTMVALALVAIARPAAIALGSGGGNGKKHRGHTVASSRSEGEHGASERSAQSPTPARIALAARYLGLSSTQLHSRLEQGGSLAQIAQATKGKSARGLVEALVAGQTVRLQAMKISSATRRARLERYRQRVERVVAHARGTPAIERDLLAASSYLGLGDGQLHTRLQQGETLAQVAASTPGRSPSGLEQAIVNGRRARVSQAQAAGLISRGAASRELASLPALVEAELHRKLLQGS